MRVILATAFCAIAATASAQDLPGLAEAECARGLVSIYDQQAATIATFEAAFEVIGPMDAPQTDAQLSVSEPALQIVQLFAAAALAFETACKG